MTPEELSNWKTKLEYVEGYVSENGLDSSDLLHYWQSCEDGDPLKPVFLELVLRGMVIGVPPELIPLHYAMAGMLIQKSLSKPKGRKAKLTKEQADALLNEFKGNKTEAAAAAKLSTRQFRRIINGN